MFVSVSLHHQHILVLLLLQILTWPPQTSCLCSVRPHLFFPSGLLSPCYLVFMSSLPILSRSVPCCTHCTGQSVGSGVPCTHSLLLSLATLLLFLHRPPPPASCQTDPPCSLHPYCRMEKQSSRNSPDNCPSVIFFPPLSRSLHFAAPSSVVFPFKAFFFNFLFRELDWSPCFFREKGKRKFLTAFFSLEGGERGQSFWSVLVFQKCKSDPQAEASTGEKLRTQQFCGQILLLPPLIQS